MAINHNWLNLAMATPSRIIPIVVTVAVGPEKSAVFYVAWMISSLLFMVPVHLGTVLFALASASPEVVAEKLRFVLRVSLLIGLPVMAVLAIGAHFMLGVYDTPKNGFIYSSWAPCRSGCSSSATYRRCRGRSSSRSPARPTGSARPPA